MIINPSTGEFMFENVFDMYYDLFMELGLGIDANNYLYDQDSGNMIMMKDKYIKATIDPNIPIYAGRNDIVFEPDKNYGLISTLFGFYLDKCVNSDDGDQLQGYIAHFVDDKPDPNRRARNERSAQRVVVRTAGRGDIESRYYFNIYLAYIDCIFRIAGYNVNLDNFDIVR